MLTGKQRAYLRSAANDAETIFQIGKGGINDNMREQLSNVLEARELIKIRTLDNTDIGTREAADSLCADLGAECVGIKGSRIVLYRESKKHKKISLELKNV